MAKAIEFYTPTRFRRPLKTAPQAEFGTICRVLSAGEKIGIESCEVVFALACSCLHCTNTVEFTKDEEKAMNDEKKDKMMQDGLSRRSVLGIGSAALAAAAFRGLSAHAQTREGVQKAEGDHSLSNPGPENKPLLSENPNSNTPPPTDFGDVGSIWYSYDLTKKRVQEGGWTHQVTQRELPSSRTWRASTCV
jgi:hypothetical protein